MAEILGAVFYFMLLIVCVVLFVSVYRKEYQRQIDKDARLDMAYTELYKAAEALCDIREQLVYMNDYLADGDDEKK